MANISNLEYEVSAFNWGRINLKIDMNEQSVTIKTTSMGSLDFQPLEESDEIKIFDDNFLTRHLTFKLTDEEVIQINKNLDEKVEIKKWQIQYEDPFISDGESWEIQVNYEDGSQKRSCGLNKFPEQYKELMNLIKPLIDKAGIVI